MILKLLGRVNSIYKHAKELFMLMFIILAVYHLASITLIPLSLFAITADQDAKDSLVAVNKNVTTAEDNPLTIVLNGSDKDGIMTPLQFNIVSKPIFGNLKEINITSIPSTLPNMTYTLANTTYLPIQDFHGNDNFTFLVNDSTTNTSDIGTVLITVDSVNDPPISNAGKNQTINEGTIILLDGTASTDPDIGDRIATYSWSQISGVPITLIGSNTSTPKFTAPNVTDNTLLEFDLKVTDTNGTTNVSPNTVGITITNLPSTEINPFMPDIGTIYIYLGILLFALLVPLFYDLIQGYRHSDKEGKPAYTDGLSRTLLAYGILIIIAGPSFHVLITITNNIQSNNPAVIRINSSFVEITENMTTLFGGAVSAIIGFYFGQRSIDNRRKLVTGAREVAKPGPSIVSKFPNDGSSGVAITTPVKAIFSEPLDGTTVNETTFALKVNKTQKSVDGTVNLSDDGKTAEFKPTDNLSTSTLYVVTIAGIKDLFGNVLADPITWSFTTG